MNPEIQEQRVIEIILDTCRKLDVKFRYEVAGSDEAGIYLILVYDRSWRKLRALLAIAAVQFSCAACLLTSLISHWLFGPNFVGLIALMVVSLSTFGVSKLVIRMPIHPWSVIHWHIDGELRAAGFHVRRHSENAAEISYF